MTRNPRTNRPAGGFTMIEMLVTLAITIVLMLFVGQIFSQISDAAKSGIAVSHVLENARIISGQISDDAANMIGAGDGGFLLIDTTSGPAAALDENDATTQAYFMDQVMWVRLRGDLEPMVPNADNSYSNSADDAPYVRVYYGHAYKCQPDGSVTTAVNEAYGAGTNQYAKDWILARHAMFLGSTNGPDSTYPGFASPIPAPPGGTYYTGYGGIQYVRYGMADVTAMSLATVNAGTIDTSTVGFGSGTVKRMFVNPSPPPGDFEPWRVAMMSPILATGVSDVIVEYANITSATAPITWVRGNLTCTSGTSNWPDLIRIRFRLHAPRGALNGADGEPGAMYEKIIAVKK